MKQGNAEQHKQHPAASLTGLDDAVSQEIGEAITKTINEQKTALDNAIENDTGGLPAFFRGYARRILR